MDLSNTYRNWQHSSKFDDKIIIWNFMACRKEEIRQEERTAQMMLLSGSALISNALSD